MNRREFLAVLPFAGAAAAAPMATKGAPAGADPVRRWCAEWGDLDGQLTRAGEAEADAILDRMSVLHRRIMYDVANTKPGKVAQLRYLAASTGGDLTGTPGAVHLMGEVLDRL
ncbi:MAG: hypothetical protein ACU0CI_02160 [Shimia sp.]